MDHSEKTDAPPADAQRPPLTPEQQRLVADNLGIARMVALGLRRKGGLYRRCDVDTLFSAAYEGLCDAAPGFDPSRGFSFGTYAKFTCVARCQEAVARAGVITLPRGLVSGDASERTRAFASAALRPLRIGHARHTPEGDGPTLDVTDPQDARQSLDAEALRRLDARSRRILELRLVESKTLDEAGRDLGISKERVRQLEAKALRKLRGTGPEAEPTPSELSTLATLYFMTLRDGRAQTLRELADEGGDGLPLVRARAWALCRKRYAVRLPGGRYPRYAVVGCHVPPATDERRESASAVLAALRSSGGISATRGV